MIPLFLIDLLVLNMVSFFYFFDRTVSLCLWVFKFFFFFKLLVLSLLVYRFGGFMDCFDLNLF